MATPDDSLRVDLAEHEWVHRLVLVFAPSENHRALDEQMAIWNVKQSGFEERKLRVYHVAGMDGGRYYKRLEGKGKPITATSARVLRKRFDVSVDAFAVILIGLDGMEKRRDAEPLEAGDLFGAIDAMPMRQAEMQEEGKGRP